jgi:hypothetical protein
MSKAFVRLGLAAVSALVVGYPLLVWYANTSFTLDQTLLVSLFPAFGLVAFTGMYLHILGRPFKHILSQYIPVDRFERISSYIVLAGILLHPILRNLYFLINDLSLWPGLPVVLGMIGFLMLITYDFGKIFIRNQWIRQHWWAIDIISTLGFYVIWAHSLLLGSDLQVGSLRTLWIFYGVSAFFASGYTFLFQRKSTELRLEKD